MTDLVVLPLYPQFSISTSGSSLRLLQQMFEADAELDGLRHCVIASWHAAAPASRLTKVVLKRSLREG